MGLNSKETKNYLLEQQAELELARERAEAEKTREREREREAQESAMQKLQFEE